VFRYQNINLLFGKVNALEYGNKMFQLPTLLNIAEALDKDEK